MFSRTLAKARYVLQAVFWSQASSPQLDWEFLSFGGAFFRTRRDRLGPGGSRFSKSVSLSTARNPIEHTTPSSQKPLARRKRYRGRRSRSPSASSRCLSWPPPFALPARLPKSDPSSTAAGALRLNGRTLHRPVRAKHATVTGLRVQQCLAAAAFIEEPARIHRHGFFFRNPAARTRQHGQKKDRLIRHQLNRIPAFVPHYPACFRTGRFLRLRRPPIKPTAPWSQKPVAR